MNYVYLLIIITTITGIAIGHYPVLRMNRATISITGATILIFSGAITMDRAFLSIDMNTLVLLLGVMIIHVNLSLSGFFRLVGVKVIKFAKSPKQLLFLIIIISGLLSAIFLNDIIVLMFTPLVIEVTGALKRNPIPYLIGLATSANIGSAATITGNPQNMIIGIASHIPFLTFTKSLFPVSLTGLFLAWIIIMIIYKSEFKGEVFNENPSLKVRIYKPLLIKSIIASSLMLGGFVSGIPVSLAALTSAAILLITRRLKPERVFREIDWSLLVFFSGLFIITGSIETTGFTEKIFKIAKPIAEDSIISLSIISGILSNIVSNVPAVLLFKPFIPLFQNPEKSWLNLAMSTTFAGNFTLLGSVANLIVAESAKKRGINLTFAEYIKAGIPITLLSISMGIIWLYLLK